MLASILPYIEVVVGVGCIVSAILLFRPLGRLARSHGVKDAGKVFTLDDMLIMGWFLLISFGVGIALFGLVG